MAQDLADSLIPDNLLNFFEKIWPPLSTNAELLNKLRPHLLSCVQVIQQQEPTLFYEIVADQQEIPTRDPTASSPATLLSPSSDYTTTVPAASHLTLPYQRPCGVFPATKRLSTRRNACQPHEKSTSRTSAAPKSLSAQQNACQPYEKSTSQVSSAAEPLSTSQKSRYLPGLPETIRDELCCANAEEFFKTDFGQKDSPDFFLNLVQVEKNIWLNAIKQRALCLATLYARDKIVRDGYRGEGGYCNTTAKGVIIDVAAEHNPEFSTDQISQLISKNIDRGKRYLQLADDTSLSTIFSLDPEYSWWYERRLPKTKKSPYRKTFVMALCAGGAKTDAEIDEEFEQLQNSGQINKDVEFAKRFQTKMQQNMAWLYVRCDMWLESDTHSTATAETLRYLVEQSSEQNGRERANRHDTAPAPIQALMSDNGATSVENASNDNLLSTPPALHHEFLDVLADTALLHAQSQNTPSHSSYDHHHATEAADATKHQARASTTLSSPSSAASLFDGSLQPPHLDTRLSEASATLPSDNGQKRLYDGEDASTAKRQKSVSGPTASGLNNGVEAIMAGGLDPGPDLGDYAETTPSQQIGFVDQWEWPEATSEPDRWDWYTGVQSRDNFEDLDFGL